MTGYIYPNEIELQWGLLIVLYPYITGLVAGHRAKDGQRFGAEPHQVRTVFLQEV